MYRSAVLILILAGASCSEPQPGPGDVPPVDSTQRPCSGPSTRLYAEEHFLPTSSGAVLHVLERYSDRSLRPGRPRAILLLPGTLVTAEQYDAQIPEDGSYNALDRLAASGFFAYAVTYEGYGLSSNPADGRTVTAERLLGEMGEVVTWVRARSNARRVDLMGCSLGSSLAVALGGAQSPVPRGFIGRLILTSNVYRSVTPLMEALLLSPETQAALASAPGGYIQTVPDMYGIMLASATPEAVAWVSTTFPGIYAVGPTLEGFDLPVFDAASGRAPALQFWGDHDLVTPWGDVEQFQTEYGGPVAVVVLAGGGHAPFLEPVREAFWASALRFLRQPGPRHRPAGAAAPN